jgi:hypothetical protein
MTDTSRFESYRESLQRGSEGLYDESTQLARDKKHVIYYTPLEFEKPEADLVIVGISPGPEQLKATYSEAASSYPRVSLLLLFWKD